MDLDIRVRKLARGPLGDHARRRIRTRLRRFAPRVRSVRLSLSDVNGPRGGDDKRCLVHVHLDHRPDVIAEAVDSRAWVAVDRAVARAGRGVARALGRADRVDRRAA